MSLHVDLVALCVMWTAIELYMSLHVDLVAFCV